MSDPAIIVRRRRRRDWLAIGLGLYVALFIAFLLLPILAVVAVSFSAASHIAFPVKA